MLFDTVEWFQKQFGTHFPQDPVGSTSILPPIPKGVKSWGVIRKFLELIDELKPIKSSFKSVMDVVCFHKEWNILRYKYWIVK